MRTILFITALLLIPGLFVYAIVQAERKQRELTSKWAAANVITRVV